MKVIIFGNSGWCLYNYRKNLICDLHKRGFKIIALSPLDAYAEKLKALDIEHIPIDLQPKSLNPLNELRTVWKLWTILREVKPDYVFSFTVKCNMYAGICRLFGKFEQVANVSGLGEVFDRPGIVNRVVCGLYKLGLSGAQRVFFQNREDLEFCVSRKLVRPTSCKRIPGSGVDLTRFSPALPPRRAGGRTFLMFGRLIPRKGYDAYLEAARVLRARYGDRCEFLVLGIEDKNRAESTRLLERVKAAHLAGDVKYIPSKDDVLPIVEKADVVVLPSGYNEGVPRSLLEALACGKVIVTTDWKGCRETVEHGVNGELVPVGDVPALTKALENMILASDDEIRRMGIASRALAERKFDENIVITSYLDELQQAA
jgi:glycosyltransferase involved in cell wall biosynthesis